LAPLPPSTDREPAIREHAGAAAVFRLMLWLNTADNQDAVPTIVVCWSE